MKKTFVFAAVVTIVLSSCAQTPAPEAIAPVTTPVPPLEIAESTYQPVTNISGTLKPKFQSAVAAETSGTVAQIYANEGDRVRAGQPLLIFSATQNVSVVELSSARQSLANANKSLDLSKQQATEQEKSALLGVERAKEALANAKKTDTSTVTSVEAQVATAETAVEVARINLENATKSLEETRQNLDEQERNLQQDERNTIATAVNTFRNVLQQADQLLGATEENRKNNDAFEIFLGFREPQTRIDSINTLKNLWTRFLVFEQNYRKDPASVTGEEAMDFGQEIRDLLQQTDIMLQKSTTGADFPETTLNSFRNSNAANRSAVEQVIQNITGIEQAIDNFVINRPQQLRIAQLGVEQAQKQLEQSEKSLIQAQSGGNVTKVNTENALSTAENSLKTALAQLDITRKQNEISIQQAETARDSAANALSRAQVQYSKLAVDAPTDGVIIEKHVEVGDTVSNGTPLLIIGQIDTLLLQSDVSAEILPNLRKGMPATVNIDVFGEREGVVSKIFPVADQATRRITIEISVENSDLKIPANIFATATISLPAEEGVIMIPLKSLITQNPPAVYVIGEGEAGNEIIPMTERREVTLGREDGDMVEVLMGLSAGEEIVAEPVLGLKNGDAVEIIRDTREPEETENGEIPADTDDEKTVDNEAKNKPSPEVTGKSSPENGKETPSIT